MPNAEPAQSGTEYRRDPRDGIVYVLVSEKGSVVTIRPLGVAKERTVSYGTWVTWERWTDA